MNLYINGHVLPVTPAGDDMFLVTNPNNQAAYNLSFTDLWYLAAEKYSSPWFRVRMPSYVKGNPSADYKRMQRHTTWSMLKTRPAEEEPVTAIVDHLPVRGDGSYAVIRNSPLARQAMDMYKDLLRHLSRAEAGREYQQSLAQFGPDHSLTVALRELWEGKRPSSIPHIKHIAARDLLPGMHIAVFRGDEVRGVQKVVDFNTIFHGSFLTTEWQPYERPDRKRKRENPLSVAKVGADQKFPVLLHWRKRKAS